MCCSSWINYLEKDYKACPINPLRKIAFSLSFRGKKQHLFSGDFRGVFAEKQHFGGFSCSSVTFYFPLFVEIWNITTNVKAESVSFARYFTTQNLPQFPILTYVAGFPEISVKFREKSCAAKIYSKNPVISEDNNSETTNHNLRPTSVRYTCICLLVNPYWVWEEFVFIGWLIVFFLQNSEVGLDIYTGK